MSALPDIESIVDRGRRDGEAAAPPPIPKRTFAHPGGRIVTSDKLDALESFVNRKGAQQVGKNTSRIGSKLEP